MTHHEQLKRRVVKVNTTSNMKVHLPGRVQTLHAPSNMERSSESRSRIKGTIVCTFLKFNARHVLGVSGPTLFRPIIISTEHQKKL